MQPPKDKINKKFNDQTPKHYQLHAIITVY